MSGQKANTSYLELCIQLDRKESVYLRVPTLWDDIHCVWRAFVKTPKLNILIHAEGEDSFSLQNNFNKALSEVFMGEDEGAEDLFSAFKPLSFWEDKLGEEK